MTQKRKTPDILRTAIELVNNELETVDALAREKGKPLLQQSQQVLDTNLHTVIAQLRAKQELLETLLFRAQCYAGYCHVSETKYQRDECSGFHAYRFGVSASHPEFREWRRTYYTNPGRRG